MSERAPCAGVRNVIDPATGTTVETAVGPVARLQWLEQVQADPRLGDADLAIAVSLVAFVNSGKGYAFAGHSAVAERARVDERTARRHIAKLIGAGHVLQIRRGRVPAALFLVLFDRTTGVRSNEAFDRTVQSPSTGQRQNSNGAKSVSCVAITRRINSATGAVAPARPRAPDAPSPCEIPESPAGSLSRLPALSPAELDHSARRDEDDGASPPIERFEVLNPGPGEDDVPLVDAPRPPALRPARRSTSLRFSSLSPGFDPSDVWEPEEPEEGAPATAYLAAEERGDAMPF